MQRFNLSKSSRSQWLAFPVVVLIGLARNISGLMNMTQNPSGFMPLMIITILFGVLPIIGYFLSARYYYEADSSEVVHHTLFSVSRMVWREVVQIQGGSTEFSPVVLRDHKDRKFTIPFGSLEKRGKELRSILNGQLEDLLAKRAAEFKLQSTAPRAGSPASSAAVLGIIGGFFAIMGIVVAYAIGDSASVGMGIFIIVLGVLLIALAVVQGTRRITLTDDAIEVKTAVGEKRLLFKEVESAYTYEGSNKGGPYETLTLSGRGVKIWLGSTSTPDYGLMRDRIMDLLPPDVLTSGVQARSKMMKGQVKQVAWILGICCSFFVILGGFLAKDLIERVQFVREVQKHGIRASATVVGDSCNCGSEELTTIRYNYNIDGHDYVGLNRHTAKTRGIHISDKVSVYYLEGNPGRSLLEQRLDWKPLVLDNAFILVVAFASPLMIPFVLKSARKSAEAPSE